MKFLDKKEQVLDIQMTPYGEYLLSQGKFKPEYYAFYDDNILYEPQYSGYTDSQNSIEPRIQEDTPQPATQVVFSDRDIFVRRALVSELGGLAWETVSRKRWVEDEAVEAEAPHRPRPSRPRTSDPSDPVRPLDRGPAVVTLPRAGAGVGAGVGAKAGGRPVIDTLGVPSPKGEWITRTWSRWFVEGEGGIEQEKGFIGSNYFERHRYGPQHCLGRSDILKTDAPAWSVSMFRGEITGSARAVTGSTTHTINIPQLDVTLTYKINTVNERRFISDSELAIEYPNGQFLDIRPEIILSQVIERNAEFTKENFDIEVFEVLKGSIPGTGTRTERLRPLRFKKPYNLVQGDILLDESEIFTPPDTPPTTEDVEYYFDIRVDGGISEQLICSSISELESRGLYVDAEIVCEDVKNISLVDIYSTDASADPCPDGVEDPCEDRTVY
jgi:hypothetical protein